MKKCFFILIFLQISQVLAKDLGRVSQTFPVKEEGFITMIKRRLTATDITTKQKDFEQKVRNGAMNPRSLDIKKTEKTRIYTYDPSYTVTEDIMLANGSVLHKAGTKINPLDHFSLDQKLTFIDGSDPQSIIWLKNNKYTAEKIILVAGSPLEIQQQLDIEQIYFDQFGELTKKFGIQQVPAILEQDGHQLKITEVKLTDTRL